MTKNIKLNPGDVLVITVTKEVAPPTTLEDLEVLMKVGSVEIMTNRDKTYCSFVSDLDICNDGSGPAHGDQHHQAMTAYCSGGKTGSKYMNADVDRYIVVPPQIRAKLPGVVMGCRGRVTNLRTQVVEEGVIGDIGPDDKTGETAYVLAKKLNPMIEHNSGDSQKDYLYELWPDVPGTDGDFTYKLQPA